MKNYILALFFAVLASAVVGQTEPQDSVIQFSGLVVTEGLDGDAIILPYTNIGVLGTSRGTSSDAEGYFSIVAKKGETVRFTRIGFKDVDYVIPDTLSQTLYYYIQIMSEDENILPEAVIFPWPDREYFKYEFLAIDISDDLREKAEENVAAEVLEELRYSVPVDGGEATSLVLRERARDFQYVGQTKPQNIFNPLAWKQFIDAWKRGDFKKKDKKKKK
ncbi:MAG: carboxypeptidase-like regulatory domain-containing protein [Saprospiraceae bacterium]|nr:carboxypeptidase-like regulatory domain-containing protein [Saprospiraceae bacterium]